MVAQHCFGLSSEPVVNVDAYYGPAFERRRGSEVTVIREAGPALALARQGLVKKGWFVGDVSALRCVPARRKFPGDAPLNVEIGGAALLALSR